LKAKREHNSDLYRCGVKQLSAIVEVGVEREGSVENPLAQQAEFGVGVCPNGDERYGMESVDRNG